MVRECHNMQKSRGDRMNFNEFYSDFSEQVNLLQDNDNSGWTKEDFFTVVMLDYLEEVGEVEEPIICPCRSYGIQLNAYAMDNDCSKLTLFVSVYREGEEIQNIAKTDVDAALKRAIQIYRRATNDLYKAFEKDNTTYEFALTVKEHAKEIKNVDVVALINGNCEPIPFQNIKIGETEVAFGIWDMDRLYRCISSGKMRETIEIDFESMFGNRIPCIRNMSSDIYDAYVAIIPGDILASIYSEYGARLLEKNVRSFLQVKGAVNKGIRDTLKNEPEMFLAYNNGISVTAENIILGTNDEGNTFISKMRDMQIVNGGQTTASIYNITKEKDCSVDLAKVFVQMKVSVVKTENKMDEVIRRISECANTQNKIQMADFSSNDPFNLKMEELSRVIWAPAVNGMKPCNWFFERARGQYLDMLNREGTPAKRKIFKDTHPLFTKTDLAKYENTWNQMPYYVSEGAQKNFKRFMIILNERGRFIPDEKYYNMLIAKAILYRQTERLVQQQRYGGYRANIVTYTIALLSHLTAQRINLMKIWKEQRLSENLESEIISISKLVHSHIMNPPNNANISEYCKKKSCWEALIEKNYCLSATVNKELLDTEYEHQLSGKQGIQSSFNVVTEDERALIDKIASVSGDKWLAISKWAKDTDNLQSWQRGIAFSVGTLIKRGKKPSFKQAKQAEVILDVARSKGFLEE